MTSLRKQYASASTASPAARRASASGSPLRTPREWTGSKRAVVGAQRVAGLDRGRAVGGDELPVGAAREDLAAQERAATVPPAIGTTRRRPAASVPISGIVPRSARRRQTQWLEKGGGSVIARMLRCAVG